MTITSRTSVLAAFTRALSLHPCRESAIEATAQALGLPAELVRECVE